jgi:hypothetical protein
MPTLVQMAEPEALRDDPRFLRALLEGLPGGVFLIDEVGTIRFATAEAAALVDSSPDEMAGHNVLEFVDEETAWAYAAAVAMAGDYEDVVTGPLRVTVVTSKGERRVADLWTFNRQKDEVLAGIVCLMTPATAATGLSEAVAALAAGTSFPALAALVARAMLGHPVVGDAAILATGPSGLRVVAAADDDLDRPVGDQGARGGAVPTVDGPPPGVGLPGPWDTALATGVQQLPESVDELPEVTATVARERGYETVWVEPIGSPPRGVIVVWRQRPSRPSPNQLNLLHQAASILALAWDRHDRAD